MRDGARAALIDALTPLDGVLSVRFVGSYWDKEDPATTPSDVDVVVILSQLTRERFAACVAAIAALDGDAFGFPGTSVRVNDTFGPRKLGAGETVVVHLMVYDTASHREHVLASPFTCLDWERVDHGYGPSLREHFAVPPLSPLALRDARRGVANYLADLQHGTLSVRHYEWDTAGSARVAVQQVPLDSRNRGEFAVHVVNNLLANLAKVLSGKNEKPVDSALRALWSAHIPAAAHLQDEYFAIARLKRTGATDYPARVVELAIDFVNAFAASLDELLGSLRQVVWVRHGQTAFNDGSFLGQRRDPPLLHPEEIEPLPFPVSDARSSPARRAVQTAERLLPGAALSLDARLHEMDYGQAEGFTRAMVEQQFPEIAAGWRAGSDPRFPGGEHAADVHNRLMGVIADLPRSAGTSVCVSHNNVLRIALGSHFAVPTARWHLIEVPHLLLFVSHFVNGRLVFHLPAVRLGAVLDLRSTA